MVLTNVAKNKLALLMAYGSGASFPKYCAIGDGSGTALATNGSLFGESGTRADYTSIDVSTPNVVEWVYDFSSVVMSGLNLREFGIFDTPAISGTMWARATIPVLNFDGSNELQIQVKFEIY